MENGFEHDVDRLAQEVIDANPGSAMTAAYRAVAIDLFSKASASPQPRPWFPIETAPKNGRHIQAANFSGKDFGRDIGFGSGQSYQCVVHWWQWCDGTHQEEWGWYPSTGAGESDALTTLTHWKPLEEFFAAAPAQEPRQDLYVIGSTGDGAQTIIVPESKLKQSVHDTYCACGLEWQKCADEVIAETLVKVDDEEEWTREYPNYKRHTWSDHGEDYTVTIMRVAAAQEQPVENSPQKGKP